MATWTALTTLPGPGPAEALGLALEDLDPAPTGIGVFEIEDGSGLWEVGGYFEARPNETALALLAAVHGARPFAVSKVEDRDWVEQVRRELHPVPAGRFIMYGGHDADRIPPAAIGLRIEAAMAFGTGHHASTRGCLELFDRMLRRGLHGRRVADIGCGTGVLAIAAAKAWRARCMASDIDPVATRTAAENARVNGVQGLVRCVTAAGFRNAALIDRAPYDLVFANILARPLMRLAPQIAAHLVPGGRAILAGLLTSQAPGVEAVFRGHGLVAEDRFRQEGWTSLALRRAV